MDHTDKLSRASAHLDEFHSAVEAFFAADGYTTVAEYDVQSREHRTRVVVHRPLPAHWPLIIGDCLFNMRAALDWLVHALSERANGGPLSDP